MTEIENAPETDQKYFMTTTKHTSLSQRSTLELAMKNLAALLGIDLIYRKHSARGGTFYQPQDSTQWGYQSASNTLLEMSARLIARKSRKP